MKALVQRCTGKTEIISRHEDRVDEDCFEGPGMVVLLGWEQCDLEDDDLSKKEQWIVSRVLGLRIFPDKEDRLNLNLADYLEQNEISGGGILWVSQFTLAGELKSGFRPSFIRAMEGKQASIRYACLREKIKDLDSGYKHSFGVFGADMQLRFTNWGPLTIPLGA